jgi:hypothetical protein
VQTAMIPKRLISMFSPLVLLELIGMRCNLSRYRIHRLLFAAMNLSDI